MHVTAKVDYAVRALVEIAAVDPEMIRAEVISEQQEIPLGFLRGILTDLRRAGLIYSQTGAAGGFRLAVPANRITVADVFRSIEGPLAEVRGERPHDLEYLGNAEALRDVWVALRANLRSILDATTIEDVVKRRLPKHVAKLASDPASWEAVSRPGTR